MTTIASVVRGAPGTVHAILGPTNTGKTHVALQRMLAHRSGMIGLPLRLLAREVYERVVAAKGSDQVALVTGEEKIVPPDTRYWVCTVESMPVARPVAFLAVDEIQLAADPWRGHVFTDRLLHARGVAETWFLGSDTIEPLLRELVPEVMVRRQPRLSALSYTGRRKLVGLAPRTAIVAFSVQRVYELAERLRSRHGGAAVVLGALSPRTRNAQVELFESGQVAHLVATDAIGMGLNLDIRHVALAGLHKFDGRRPRPLRADELAQVAGRAGRWRRDGSFGETAGVPDLDEEMVEAIVHHHFAPVTSLWWRNPALSFDSVAALSDSLGAAAPHARLKVRRGADDARVLAALAARPEVRQRAGDLSGVRLLWDVCGVPDFGNLLPEEHAGLLETLYLQLIDHDGVLPDDWVGKQVARLDRTDGDIATLTARIAAIRTWTYVSHRRGWTHDSAHWQARTRAVEDGISDALHEQLTARFVDRRAAVWSRRVGGDGAVALRRVGDRVLAGDESVGAIRGLQFELSPGARPSKALLKAVRTAVAPLMAERLGDLVHSPHDAFSLEDDGTLRWDGAPVGRLVPGDHWLRPRMRALRSDWVEGDGRARLARRLERWCAEHLASLSAEAADLDARAPSARGVAHALARSPGAVPVGRIADQLRQLPPGARRALQQQGVIFGRGWVVLPAMIARATARWQLWQLAHPGAARLPDDGGWQPVRASWPTAQLDALGFARVEGWVVRLDALEGLLANHGASVRALPVAVRDAVRRRFGAPRRRARR